MALSSAEIAGMSGQFQGMYQQQMAYSGMIGGLMNMSGPPQLMGEQVAGGAMNRLGGIAGPAASFGLGMMGMDPLSIGLHAGMGAYGAGAGVIGGAAAGIGAAGMAALPLMAAQYAGSQMMTGAQQQQQFNAGMRQSFPFNQPYGQGFSTTQLGGIASDLRGMAGMTGPSGEMTSFRELAGLASNMGRMGMATGVRDVQTFKQRFTEMLNTVKTVATELGTSLQQAQEAMASMRGSGVFRTADQVKFAMQMRQYSVAGGLSTAELGAMGSIGAQIARSVGGRGAAGAFGGMRTLGTIGSALQSGTLTDEDIYNATGMYGAEGRQALATRQMESSASFLRTGRGRYFLASVAGANGGLDSSSVSEWMSGGVGVGETKRMAHGNLGRVGRANFIRNEGRLRGAALEQFGGLLPAMALSQWAGEKGVDINNMGDREMLFASRQLGMGMDELESTIKEARNLPRLMQEQRNEKSMDSELRRIASMRRNTGIEGVKRTFEKAREQVQNNLQQIGADFYTQTSDYVERWLNRMAGVYVEELDKQAISAYQGAGSRSELGAMTGIGRQQRGLIQGISAGGGGALRGGGSKAFFGEGGGPLGGLFRGTSASDQYENAGFGRRFGAVQAMGVSAGREGALRDQLSYVERFTTNIADPTVGSAGGQYGALLRDQMRQAYAAGIAGKKGDDRVGAVEMWLSSQKGNSDAQRALAELRSLKPEERGAFIAKMEQRAGIGGSASISSGLADLGGGFVTGGLYTTRGEQAESRGAMALGERAGMAGAFSLSSAVPRSLTAAERERVDKMSVGEKIWSGIKAITGVSVIEALTGTSRRQQKMGEFLLSEEGKAYTRALSTGNPSELMKAFEGVQSKYMELQGNPNASPDELNQAKLTYGAALVAKKAMEKGSALTEDEANAVAKELGIAPDRLRGMVQAVTQGFKEDQATAIRSITRAVGSTARNQRNALLASGVAKYGEGGNLILASAALGKGAYGGDISHYLAQVSAQSQLTLSMPVEEQARLQGQGLDAREAMDRALWSHDPRSLRREQQWALSKGAIGFADVVGQVAGEERRMMMQFRRGGAGGAIMQALGLKMDRGTLAALRNGPAEANVAGLLERAGLGGEGTDALRSELTSILGTKDKTEQMRQLSRLERGETAGGRELMEKEKQKGSQADRDKNPTLASIDDTLKEILERSTRTSAGTEKIVSATSELNSKVKTGDAMNGQPGDGTEK